MIEKELVSERWNFDPELSKEDFEIICEEVTEKCASELRDGTMIGTSDSRKMAQFLLEKALQLKDGEEMSATLEDYPGYEDVRNKVMKKNAENALKNDYRYTSEMQKRLLAQLDSQQITKKEFTKLVNKIFEDLNRTNNEQKLKNGSKNPLELRDSILEILSGHKSFRKLQKATLINESHRQQFELMFIKRLSMYLTKNSKRGKKIENKNELEALCHRVFEECGNRHVQRYPGIDFSDIELDPFLYEKFLFDELYQHSDFSRILKMIAGDGEKCSIFMSLLKKYAVLTLEGHKRTCDFYLNNQDMEHESENRHRKKLRKKEKKEEEKWEDCPEFSEDVEKCLRKLGEQAENLKIEREKVEKTEKFVEELKKEKKNLEKMLETLEKTMTENMKKEREHSRKLIEDLKIEKENSRRIAENLELGRSKIEILEKENQNYEDSQKWFRSELEKFEKKASKENEKMKKLADDLKIEKENKRRIAEILELEREDARVLAEKMNKEKLEIAENMKKEKEISKKLAEVLKTERENSQHIAENLENMQKENQNYQDSLEMLKNELEKAERFIENIKETQINEEKEKEQMARRISAMEEFQKLNNEETEEWKELIMKMFEKQADELRMAKQELKQYKQRE